LLLLDLKRAEEGRRGGARGKGSLEVNKRESRVSDTRDGGVDAGKKDEGRGRGQGRKVKAMGQMRANEDYQQERGRLTK
jgi:hypothetical protein